MKKIWMAVAAVALKELLSASPALASAALYTNSPCVYLIVSNGVSQSATLLGTTGSFSGSLAVPVYVKSSLFNVTAIAPGAFKDCRGLTALALDSGSKVQVIGEGAFWGCTNLASVTLRDSVGEVGASAFLGCSALTNVSLSAATGLTSVAAQTFSGCSSLAAMTLPAAVTNVGDSAFRSCVALTSVALPSSAVSVGDSAFQGCSRLASASFPGATRLGHNAFAASGLASVTIPAGLTNLAQGAFADCTNLAAVTYAGSPVEIGSGAFKNCAALAGLPVAASLSDLDAAAFAGCAHLASAALPSGVRSIPESLFANCTNLASVTCGGAVTNIGEYAFANTALTSYSLPADAGYRAVDAGTFYGCARLTSVAVPANVTNAVKSEAFARCASLTEVSLTNSLADALHAYAFYGCSALRRATLPATVRTLGEAAFGACPALTNVTARGDAPEADASAFAGSVGVFVYYYKGASGWSNLLASRPTVMIGADGAGETLSFAAWAVRGGLADASGLSDASLSALFEAESSSLPGLANGAVYAFGSNLTVADQVALLQIFIEDGTPYVESPALVSGVEAFVTVAVEGTADLASGVWDLPVSGVTLSDVTRAGYTPAPVDGVIPAAACFRLKLALTE